MPIDTIFCLLHVAAKTKISTNSGLRLISLPQNHFMLHVIQGKRDHIISTIMLLLYIIENLVVDILEFPISISKWELIASSNYTTRREL